MSRTDTPDADGVERTIKTHDPPASSTPASVNKTVLTPIVVILLGMFVGAQLSPTPTSSALGGLTALFTYGFILLSRTY